MSRRRLLFTGDNVSIPNNQIWYTTVNNEQTYIELEFSDLVLKENTYYNGLGVMTFDKSITSIPRGAFRFNKYISTIKLPDSIEEIEFSAFSEAVNLKDIKLPKYLKAIRQAAFADCTSLNSIYLPNTLQTIEKYTFSRSYLSNISIPGSISNFGEGVFSECIKLYSVNIDNGIQTIKKETFKDCSSLTKISLPDSIISIEDNAFFNCISLKQFYIPYSVENIGNGVFGNCYLLKSFTGKFASEDHKFLVLPLNNNDYKLVAYAMGYTPIDNTYTIPDYVTIIGSESIYNINASIYDYELDKTIILPEGIHTIENNAFIGNISYDEDLTIVLRINSDITTSYENSFNNFPFKKVIFSNTVTSIKDNLCKNITSLEEVIIEGEIKEIGNSAFENINGNANIIFYSMTPPSLGHNVFSGIDNLTIEVPKDAVGNYINSDWYDDYKTKIKNIADVGSENKIIYTGKLSADIYPEGEDNVLSHNKGTIIFSKPLTLIPENKFKEQKDLKTIILPSKLETIGYSAFEGCTNLKGNFNLIPSSVKTIEERAFRGCTSLYEVNIPNSVTKIGAYTFNIEGDLTIKCFCQNPPTINSTSFFSSNTEIWILENKYDTYSTTSVWEEYKDILARMDSKGNRIHCNNEIWYQTNNNKKLSSDNLNCKKHIYKNGIGIITLFEDVYTVPENYFAGENTLKYVSLPGIVKTIGKKAFFNCSNLSIEKEEVEEDATRIVVGGGGLLPEGNNTSVNKNIKVELPESIEYISDEAFMGCVNIININLPKITHIGKRAFKNCDKLEKIFLPEKIEFIMEETFKSCTSLQSIELSNIVGIGTEAFEGCINLNSIVLNNIEYIENNAFLNTNIKSVYIDDINNWCNVRFGTEYSNPINSNTNFYANTVKLNDTEINISNTFLGKYTFTDCKFKSVTISEDCEEIEDNAFIRCKIPTVSINSSTYWKLPFSDTQINNVNIKISDIDSYIENNRAANIQGKKYLRNEYIQDGTLTIPNRVKSIGNFAFSNSNITKIIIPSDSKLEKIGAYAFFECEIKEVKCYSENPPAGDVYMFGDPNKLKDKSILIPRSYFGEYVNKWEDIPFIKFDELT